MEGTKDEWVLTWMMVGGCDVVDEAIHELGLKSEGSIADKKCRLRKWLVGDYSAEDFADGDQDLNEEEVKVKREELRASFIARTIWERSGATIMDPNFTRSDEHLLAVLLEEELVMEVTQRLQEAETSRQHLLIDAGHPGEVGYNNAAHLAVQWARGPVKQTTLRVKA